MGSLKRQGAKRVRMLCMVAAPEGVQRMLDGHPDVHVYTAALDRELNVVGYILPAWATPATASSARSNRPKVHTVSRD